VKSKKEREREGERERNYPIKSKQHLAMRRNRSSLLFHLAEQRRRRNDVIAVIVGMQTAARSLGGEGRGEGTTGES